jgi:glycosyltransferase involved in cell wall biosynthesis
MTKPPRVLFISSPTDIGADTWIHFLLLQALDRDRFELHAAGQKPTPGEPAIAWDALTRIPEVRLHPTDFGPSLFGSSPLQKAKSAVRALPAALGLAELALYVKKNGIQILHSTDRPRDAMACAAIAAATGAKSVIHVHVKYGDWMSRGVKWAMGRADALIGVSDFVADSLVQAGYRRERTHGVLNAIVPSKWDPSLDPGPGRASLGVPSDAPVIVSVARLFGWKGHAELVRAVALLKPEFPGVRLAIVGADYPAHSGVSASLAELAASLGVRENVILAGQRSDIASLLAASDVFSLPSFEEPFGLVFAEAMAMKKPVVALRNGGTPEVVEHGISGFLSDPGDIRGLAEHLATLLRNPALRAQMGENGRKSVEARFTPGRMATDVASVYAGLLNPSIG